MSTAVSKGEIDMTHKIDNELAGYTPAKIEQITVSIQFTMLEVPDEYPDLSYLQQNYADFSEDEAAKYRTLDAARLAAYNNGEWAAIGIKARANITVHRGYHSALYTLDSPGLWGIESDCDPAYKREVFAQEVAELRTDIEAIKLWNGAL
jgi:hypothetical protein